ncbi:MAG: MoaD/ThiS family protein [Deltaproteobacteria bacterium]|nr:MoaD/ThiS family protein [Deltaproteobacteria bacterium]
MQVTVRLVGVVQHLLREPELRLDLPDRCTPEEMFDHLIAGLGPSLQTYLRTRPGVPAPGVTILIDGEAVRWGETSGHPLQPGTGSLVEVVVLGPPPMGG